MLNTQNTREWAMQEALKAEDSGNSVKSCEYMEIAFDCLKEETPFEELTEVPSGGTGFFVTAEKRGKRIIN